MREFMRLPRPVWNMVGVAIGWLIPLGVVGLVKADVPLPVALLTLLVGIILAVILYIHRAQWRSSDRLADKQREEEEQRRQAMAYEEELEARKREYEAFRRRNSPDA